MRIAKLTACPINPNNLHKPPKKCARYILRFLSLNLAAHCAPRLQQAKEKAQNYTSCVSTVAAAAVAQMRAVAKKWAARRTMARDGIIDANLHINAAFYPRRIPVAAATHTISHNKIIHTARAHFYLLPPDVLALFKCFVSKAFFMVCACVIPHAAGCRREKLKQTGWRRKERCWMLIAAAGSRARNVKLLCEISACSTSGNLFSWCSPRQHCLARPYRFVRQFFNNVRPCKK